MSAGASGSWMLELLLLLTTFFIGVVFAIVLRRFCCTLCCKSCDACAPCAVPPPGRKFHVLDRLRAGEHHQPGQQQQSHVYRNAQGQRSAPCLAPKLNERVAASAAARKSCAASG